MVKLRPRVLVMAAGRGLRFRGEGHKLQQALGDSSVLACTLAQVRASTLPYLVVGSEGLRPFLRSLVAEDELLVMPELSRTGKSLPSGMGHSIAAGVAASGDAAGWLVLPGDMPLVQAGSLLAVADALQDHPVSYAQYKGRRGHPIGFAAELYSELILLEGDEGAKRLLARYPAIGVELDDPGVLIDIDTSEDLQRVRAELALSAAR